MRWHTEECMRSAFQQGIFLTRVFAEAECLPECEQKWREFVDWTRAVTANASETTSFTLAALQGGVLQAMKLLGIDEEVNDTA